MTHFKCLMTYRMVDLLVQPCILSALVSWFSSTWDSESITNSLISGDKPQRRSLLSSKLQVKENWIVQRSFLEENGSVQRNLLVPNKLKNWQLNSSNQRVLLSYRIVNEILLPISAGRGPLKLLRPKSKTSNSFKQEIPSGINPCKELFRKTLQHICNNIIRQLKIVANKNY